MVNKYCVVVAMLAALTGCGTGLQEVADQVPVAFTCGINSDEQLESLLVRYVSDPKTVTSELKAGFESKPAETICLLVDGERYLQRVGKRGSQAYDAVIAALIDLEVL